MDLGSLEAHVVMNLNHHRVDSHTPDETADFLTSLYVRDYINKDSITNDELPVTSDNFCTTFSDYSLSDYAIDKGFDNSEMEGFMQRVYEALIYEGSHDELAVWRYITQIEVNTDISVGDLRLIHSQTANPSKSLYQLYQVISAPAEESAAHFHLPNGESTDYQSILTNLFSKYIMFARAPNNIKSFTLDE